MGTFISTINQDKNITTSNHIVWCESLQKIKEYHGMFKYVCDSFVINHEQCKEIFGSLQKAKIWDPQSSGRIDALQIFSGLVIFSKEASFKKKLSFLFSIFDFNEIKSLSFIDVEVIALNVCNSAYKILNKNGKVNENEIADWLMSYLPKKERIKITQLYYFCMSNTEILSFSKSMKKILQDESILFPEEISKANNQSLLEQTTTRINYSRCDRTYKLKEQITENLEWHRDLMSKIVKVQQKEHSNKLGQNYTETNYGCKISWVYGINISGCSKPFIPIRKAGEKIVYRASSMAIVYDLQIGQQQIIQGHLHQVSCIAYSQKNQILATVQYRQFPPVILWKRQLSSTRKQQEYKIMGTINTNHNKGIKLIQFISKQTLLATVGVRSDSPILIYDYEKQEIVHQLIIKQSIGSIFNPFVLTQRSQVSSSIFNTFFAISSNTNRIYEISLKYDRKVHRTSSNASEQIKVYEYYQIVNANKITSAVSFYGNITNPYLRSYKDKSCNLSIITGHQSGSVCLMTTISKYQQQEIIIGLNSPISCLHLSKELLGVASGQFIYLYQLDVLYSRGNAIMVVDLRVNEGLELMSYQIKYFEFMREYILAMTDSGEFVKIENQGSFTSSLQSCKHIGQSPQSQKSLPKTLPEQLKLTLIPTLTKFSGKTNLFCLLNWKQDSQMLLFSTNNNKIIGIDSQTHEIHNIWEINTIQNIVALDAVCSDDGICYVICACKSGRLYIRIDWEQSPKYYDCGNQIIDAKISKDCSYLLVATSNNYLLFFAQVNSNFTSPRKLLFQYQTPYSINFLDNFKFFLVVTSAKNSYLIQIPQLKHKKLHKEGEKITISRMDIRYPINCKKQLQYIPGCLGGDMKFSILAMQERGMYFFYNSNALQKGDYTILDAHKCQVSQIAVNENQTKFYSLGKTDNTLIQWSVFDTKYKSRRNVSYGSQYKLDDPEQCNDDYLENIQQFAMQPTFSTEHELPLELPHFTNNQTFFFKSTKNDKINESISKHIKSYTSHMKKKLIKAQTQKNSQYSIHNINHRKHDSIKQKLHQDSIQTSVEDIQFLNKRCPNISLSVASVFGFETQNKKSLFYQNEGQQIMGFSSRFIIRMNIKTNKQLISEPTSKKISYITHSSYDDEIIFCVAQPYPSIHMLSRPSLKTTHTSGIIHLSTYKNYILSYAICSPSSYSINLHNYVTGQLIRTTFTNIKVLQFIMLNQNLTVSLNQVRIWKYLYPSQPIVSVSTGCLLPNGKDILFGLNDGRFGILSERGIFQLQNQAHQKCIDFIAIKHDGESIKNFEIVSIGKDQKVKIWTNNFQIKMQISFRQRNNIVFMGDNNKPLDMLDTILVKTMDLYKNKILLSFQYGQIVQIELETLKKPQLLPNTSQISPSVNQSISQKSYSNMELSNNLSSSQSQSENESLTSPQLTYKWTTIHQIHTPRTKQTSHRRTYFTLNTVYPLIAYSACQNEIIIQNYLTSMVIYKCYYQNMIVECIKFSGTGALIGIGFNNGELRFYELKVNLGQDGKISTLALKIYQKFIPKFIDTEPKDDHKQKQQKYSIINMEFSQCSTYFAMSYIKQSYFGYQSCIAIYKTRQSSNIQNYEPQNTINNGELQYYFLADTIELTGYIEKIGNTHSFKYLRSAYFIAFSNEAQEPTKTHSPSNSPNNSLNQSATSNPRNLKQSRDQSQIKLQKSQIYLILYEQYLDNNKIRINTDTKTKIKVYQIQDKAQFTQEYNINFLKVKFPIFVNCRSFKTCDEHIRGGILNVDGYNGYTYPNDSTNEQQNKYVPNESKSETDITLTEMVTIGQNIIYGDTSGKLHITKLSSLLPNLSSKITLERSKMNLSKTYYSHTTSISQIEINPNYEYLFVSSVMDNTVVKYQIKIGNKWQQLDWNCYNVMWKDVHEEYLSKNKFYQFLNDVDPIRNQISDVMIDVETKHQNQKESTELEMIRIFGRRAFDKRSNLFQDNRGNLVYSLGPNIIIENPSNPHAQAHIPCNPASNSNSPQISALSLNSKYLLATTEEQTSRLFIWDIYSTTCLSQLRLQNFSIVYHIVQSTTRQVVLLYGINNLYQPCMQLIDWQSQKILGTVSLMYSGCWKIKDICEVCVKDDGFEFVSCGVQHLCYWQYIGGTLVYSPFGAQQNKIGRTTFMAIRSMDEFIVTGCQNGSIYIFKNFSLECESHIHNGPIKTIEIDNELIFTAGLYSRVYVSTISIDQNQKYFITTLEQHNLNAHKNKEKQLKNKHNDNLTQNHSKLRKANSYNPDANKFQNNETSQLILVEEDIQSLVLSKCSSSFSSPSVAKVYVGTRSGNIFVIKRQTHPDPPSTKNSQTNLNISTIQNIPKTVSSRRNSSIYQTSQKICISNGQIGQIVCAHDNDTISSICFDQRNTQYFYVLTFSGVLEIWSLKTLTRIYLTKLEQQANKIFCYNENIIICCQRSILTIQIDIQENRIHYIQEMSIEYEGSIITDCIISNNNSSNSHSKKQNKNLKNCAFLVIAIKKTQWNQIRVNQITANGTKLQQKFCVGNLKYQIEFMDFSRDCKYLLFKDSFEELGMVNLENYKKINTIFVEMGIQWESQGIRISPYGQKIYCSYSRENKITVLRRISEREIIIGDQMGTLRIFDYPCSDQKIGELHTNCYSTHMNFIKNIQIHPTQPYAITTSVYDRSFILWKIKKPQDLDNQIIAE